MKIVHWAKFYPPEWGGTEAITAALAEASVRAGDEVEVVAYTEVGESGVRTRHGVHVLASRTFARIASQPLSFAYLWKAIRVGRHAHSIHIHAPNLIAALAIPFVPGRVQVVAHWHTDIVDKGWLGSVTRPLEALLARRSDVIIATSQAYAEASPALAPHQRKVAVVPLGIADPRVDEPEVALDGKIAEFVAGRPLVLSVGRLIPYKGVEYLIAAANEVRTDAAIIVVGGGPLDPQLRAQIAAHGLGNRVLMAGRVDKPTLHALFSRADLYVMSSVKRSEAFGVVLLEAMAYSLPIIATNIPGSGVPWVNEHGVTGINVPPRDPRALAEAIDTLINDPERRCSFGRAARGRFQAKFTEEKMLQSTLALYGPRLRVTD